MAMWFSDDAQEELSWAFNCALQNGNELSDKEETDVQCIERHYKSLNLFESFYVNDIESQEVKEKLNSLDCDVHTFGTKIILLKKGVTFDQIKEQAKEYWGKEYFNTEIINNNLSVKFTKRLYSSIPEEVCRVLNVTDHCLELIEKNIPIKDINRSIGKIYNLNILFFYIQRYVCATSEKIVEELFNLDLMDWDMIYEYKGKSTLTELCRDYPKVLNDFIRMLELKVEPALDKLGVEYIPFRPMLLSFKKKINK